MKIGRPKSTNPKNIDIKVRIDNSLNEKINIFCKENKITRAEFIRQSIERFLEKK